MTDHSEYELVCPDGNRRHPAYHSKNEAEFDARIYDVRGCDPIKKGGQEKICTGRGHYVRPKY